MKWIIYSIMLLAIIAFSGCATADRKPVPPQDQGSHAGGGSY
ncbi:hypothetical protein [Rhizobium sp. LC145]|nr:hypothetical protein [Rhizobium sp. LC145]